MRQIPMKHREEKQVKTVNMKHAAGKSKQLLAVILGGSLIFGMTGAGAYASGLKKGSSCGPEIIEGEEVETKKTEDAGKSSGSSVEETVYVIAEADGKPRKIIVSDWMKGGDGEDTYTQENLEKELPVDMAVSYKLDGKAVAAKDMAGKSGKLTMRFDYTNNQYEDVEIEGEVKRIYVPFVMVTGMILDNGHFANVEVSNGRVINDGDRTIVAGFAMPGLQESLELDKEKMELPGYLEVTADVTDFKLETTITLATTEVFAELDMDKTEAFDELDESMDKLTDAMGELTDGSLALYDGLTELLEKSGGLTDGIDRLASGASSLASGAGELKSGADDLKTGAGTLKSGAESLKSGTEALKSGASELKGGLGQLVDNNDAINGGAGQVFDSLLAAANSQIQAAGLSLPALTRDNYSQVLGGAIGSMDEGAVREQFRQGVEKAVREQQAANIVAQVTGGIQSSILDEALAQAGIPDQATYQTMLGNGDAAAQQIADAVAAKMGSGEIQALISQKTEETIQGIVGQQMQSPAVAEQIGKAVENAKNGAASLTALKGQLDSYNQFYQGLLTYTAGVASASDGAEQLVNGAGQLVDGAGQLTDGVYRLESGAGQLADGAGQLSDGADTLYTGIGQLQRGGGALTHGVEKLQDGAMQLSDGVEKFNEEGIEALVEAFDGEIKELRDRMKAVADAGKNYKSFKDSNGNKGESVRFIYKTEKIGED
ncbi:MAG: hypothetical protein HFI68_09895 [Lachnospiraceae bacterium]|nr:hypothetical protein [Lachnospiraceae bacterium]